MTKSYPSKHLIDLAKYSITYSLYPSSLVTSLLDKSKYLRRFRYFYMKKHTYTYILYDISNIVSTIFLLLLVSMILPMDQLIQYLSIYFGWDSMIWDWYNHSGFEDYWKYDFHWHPTKSYSMIIKKMSNYKTLIK